MTDNASDPVAIILAHLQSIYDQYPTHRREWGTDGALDATLRVVLSPEDFDSVSEFHAGLRDDEYGLRPHEGGRYLHARLVQTVESYYVGLPPDASRSRPRANECRDPG